MADDARLEYASLLLCTVPTPQVSLSDGGFGEMDWVRSASSSLVVVQLDVLVEEDVLVAWRLLVHTIVP